MSALLSHPLFVASFSAFTALVTGIVLFLISRGAQQRDKLRSTEMASLKQDLDAVKAEQRRQQDRQSQTSIDITALKSDQANLQASMGMVCEELKNVAGVVQQLSVALPTNYATNERMDRLEDGIYERLDKIAEGISQKPNRDELERKADRSELVALQTAIARSGN